MPRSICKGPVPLRRTSPTLFVWTSIESHLVSSKCESIALHLANGSDILFPYWEL